MPDHAQPSPLSLAPSGRDFLVSAVTGEGVERQRLRELGFVESTVVRLIAGGAAFTCLVRGARICLSQAMAARVQVVPA